MKPYARHGVNVNVDFYSGVVYHLHGIPRDLFMPIFAIGRVPGWTAQILEQLDNNILIRPTAPARARMCPSIGDNLRTRCVAGSQGPGSLISVEKAACVIARVGL